MASPTLLTPTTKPKPLVVTSFRSTSSSSSSSSSTTTPTTTTNATATIPQVARRQFMALTAGILTPTTMLLPVYTALAASDEEYIKETEEVIGKIRTTINMDKKDPNVAAAVSELREVSNTWVAKYRREKDLLGRASFRDMYSALNAVSGHYISFGPTAPIPVKRKQRILEEMDTAEKALLRGR